MSDWAGVKQQINQFLQPGVKNGTNVAKIKNSLFAIIDQVNAGSVDEEDATWKPLVTYAKDTEPVLYKDRWLVSNIANNSGNEPINSSGIIHGSWRLVNASSGSGISLWAAGVFPNLLEVVFREGSLYYLDREIVGDGAFNSVDFSNELNENKWKSLTPEIKFKTGLPANVQTVTPNLNWLSGFTMEQLENYPGGALKLFVDWLVPDVLAYRSVNKGVTLGGVNSQTVEVGTSVSPNLTASFNPGQIRNGNGSIAGDLVGGATGYVFRDPSGAIINHVPDDPIDNSQGCQSPVFKIAFGSNNWNVQVSHAAGTTLYYDNKNAVNPDDNLSGLTGAGNVSDNSNTMTGRYYRFMFLGARGASPDDSASIRSLEKVFLNGNNEASFSKFIPAGTSEVVVYTRSGKTVSASNPATNESFSPTQTAITVKDADGANVAYTKNVIDLGLNGFPGDATFNFSIS